MSALWDGERWFSQRSEAGLVDFGTSGPNSSLSAIAVTKEIESASLHALRRLR